MYKKFLVTITVITGIITGYNSVHAFNIVYPKSDNVTINSDKTFFIGNEKFSKNLKINNEIVDIHNSGGFKHAVRLNYGTNTFTIDNGTTKKTYTIKRPQKTVNSQKQYSYIKYETPIIVETIEDNTPLRSTPVDAGLNRLSHFQTGIKLKIIGEYGDFYKVQLSRDDNAWIMKTHVKKIENNFDSLPVDIISSVYDNNEDNEIYTFKLNRKAPYVITEEGTSGFKLTIYNVNNPFERYEFPIKHEGKNFGYSVYYDENENLKVIIKKTKTSLNELKITIDPGHGGSEFGAIGCLGDKEKDINLKLSLKLKQKLEDLGATVLITRENDKYLGLYERVKFSNANNADIFISIHNNALPDSLADKPAKGTKVYYFYPQSKEFAQILVNNISKETGLKNGGARAQSFAVVRNTNVPSVLIEAGYMIDPDENSKLINDNFQDKIIDGIINGLNEYLKNINTKEELK